MDPVLAATLGGAVGLVIGAVAVAATRWSERSAGEPASADPPLPRGVGDVLSVLRSIAVVVDASDAVVNTSASAVSYGLVRHGELVHHELRHLARQVRRDGMIREAELDLARSPNAQASVVMRVRVAPIAVSHVLILAEDHTHARRVEEIRRDFVANVSHELKTPVGGISLLAEAVLDARDDPEAVERFAQRILVESSRLTRLVQEIVDLSRLQVADTLHEPELVDVGTVVTEAVDRVRVAAEAHDIDLTLVSEERAARLRGCRAAHHRGREPRDERRELQRVRHARRHRGPPGRRRRRGDRDRPGRGHPRRRAGADLRALLPRRRRPVAGDRWHRPGARHRQARLRQPRGQVSVWSQEGRGSTFTMTLPAAADRPRAVEADPPDPRAEPRRRGPCMTRILIVEDEVSFSDPLSYLLSKEGYEVSVAENGHDALTEFDSAGADLVLLDLMLPGLSGVDVCRALRQRSNVPVIMLTAKDSEIDKVVGLELGADDYVTKPYSSRELLARIKAVLRRLAEPEELLPTTLEAGPVRMDVERHVVTVRGDMVSFPLKEFELLEMLLRNTGPGADPDAAHRPGLGQ